MATLVINAPRWRARQDNARSFESTLQLHIGESYAIPRNLYIRLNPPCGVVVLCKDQKRRAEGKLIRLAPTVKTKSGIQRYDVYMRNLKEVRYTSERLRRTGVNVI